MRRFEIDAERAGDRVDKLLARLLPETSRATIQRWILEQRVLIAGRVCRARGVLALGSVIELSPGPPPVTEVVADASVPFGVVFEDSHLVVVDKPAGIVVHPARGNWQGTLVSGLLSREGFGGSVADPRDPQGALRPGIVHRIDKDTSGLLVVAKDELSREGLKAQLARHDVEREYLALTLGVPVPGRIETLHGRDPRSRLRFTTKVREGRRAVTKVSVLERLGGGRAALVACRLETGRTHQIRVHLAECGKAPVLADALYGRRSADPGLIPIEEQLARQALHAAVLGFVHPATGQALRFESPLPADMRDALEALRLLR